MVHFSADTLNFSFTKVLSVLSFVFSILVRTVVQIDLQFVFFMLPYLQNSLLILPRLERLWMLQKYADCVRERIKCIPPWLLHHILPPGFCVEFLLWLPSMMDLFYGNISVRVPRKCSMLLAALLRQTRTPCQFGQVDPCFLLWTSVYVIMLS